MSSVSVARRLCGAVIALCLVAPLSGAAAAGPGADAVPTQVRVASAEGDGIDDAAEDTSTEDGAVTEVEEDPEQSAEEDIEDSAAEDGTGAVEHEDDAAVPNDEDEASGDEAEEPESEEEDATEFQADRDAQTNESEDEEAGTTEEETSDLTTDEVSSTAVTEWPALQDAVTEACDNGVGEVTLGETITADDGENLALTVDCDLTLDLNGFNLTVENPGNNNPAIHVPGGWGEEDDDAHLRITDTSDAGNGTLTAIGGTWGAGIGGQLGGSSDAGTVIIEGGTVFAEGGNYGAGIGGGNFDDGGDVTITGGEVTATGGLDAAGIGGGYQGDGGDVTISGGEVTATGGLGAAGIGGGYQGDGGDVTISGGEVTATGGLGAAGIGSGSGSDRDGGTVTISGGEVETTGGSNAAGIGGGALGAGGTVTVSGGVVEAHGGFRGAGIGGGFQGGGGDVTISGGVVEASGGEDAAGIGAGFGDDQHPGSLTIEALPAEGSAEHGGGSEDLRAPITWSESSDDDLYALAEADEDNPVFEVDFGYVLEVMDFRDGVDQAPVPVQDQEFLPLGGDPFTGSIPDEGDTEVPEGFTFTGWRDGAPDGDVVVEEDLVGLLDEGSVFLYATAARAGLDPETIVAGETGTVTVEAFNTEGELADVTGDADITFDDGEVDGPVLTPPTAAGTYTVGVEYRGVSLPQMSLEVVPGEADSLVVDGPTEATEAETVSYTVVLTDEHDNPISDVTGQVDVVSDVIGDQVELNQDGDAIEVTFAFTPEELVDRELTFIYPVEGDEEITATVEVVVSSAVEDIELMVPGSASHGQSVQVGVTAVGEGGEELGDVTDYAGVASDGDDDEVDGAEVRFTGAGERELTITYRGHEETATVVVDQAATEVTAVLDGTTITAGEDVVLEVTVESPVPGEHIPAGEVEVWLEDADFDEDEPLVTGELVDGEVSLEVEGLTEAEDYELVVRYPGATDFAPSTSDPVTVTVVPAAPEVVEVTGPDTAAETETVTYQVEVFDDYGNTLGAPEVEAMDVTSTVADDQISITEDGDVEVTFVFTPEALVERTLRFAYTDENGEEITTEVEVSVDSVVDEIELTADPDRAGVGTTVEVTVEAFDAGGDSLGDVTEHATVSFEGEDLSGGEFTIPSAGTHELIAAYRDQEDTVSVMGEFPVLVDLEVTGAEQATETQTVTYAVTGTDQFSDPITVDFDALNISSTVEADTITADEESSEVLVEFAFTPDGPADRTVVFTYEEDGDVIDEVQIEVEVASAVESLVVDTPDTAVDREVLPVVVTALDTDGEPLSEVTDYASITSSVDSDEITEGELTLIGTGDREITAEYRHQSASAEVTVVPAAAGVLEVTGPDTATETETVTYQVEVLDDYGNTLGAPEVGAMDVTSTVSADQISITEDGEIEVAFAFTPEELVDRELRFAYTQDGDLLVATLEVEITSAVDALAVDAPAEVGVDEAITVTVDALDADGEVLRDVTNHVAVSSSVEGDVVVDNEVIVSGEGERTLSVTYRGVTGTAVVEVTAPEEELLVPDEIILGADEVVVGETQEATATGYEAGTQVTGTMYSDPLDLGTQVADETGAVTFTWEIPDDTEPGEHTVVLTADGYQDISATFEVLAAEEPAPTPTEEPTPSEEPSEEPTPTESPTASEEPTATPAPTESPEPQEEDDLADTGTPWWGHLLPLAALLLLVLGGTLIAMAKQRQLSRRQ